MAGYPLGVIKYLGLSTLNQVIMGFGCLGSMGVSIAVLFESRFHTICTFPGKRHWTRWRRPWAFSFHAYCWLTFLSFSLFVPDQETAKQNVFKSLPCLPQQVYNGDNFVLTENVTFHLVIFMSFFFTVLLKSIALALGNSHAYLNTFMKPMSFSYVKTELIIWYVLRQDNVNTDEDPGYESIPNPPLPAIFDIPQAEYVPKRFKDSKKNFVPSAGNLPTVGERDPEEEINYDTQHLDTEPVDGEYRDPNETAKQILDYGKNAVPDTRTREYLPRKAKAPYINYVHAADVGSVSADLGSTVNIFAAVMVLSFTAFLMWNAVAQLGSRTMSQKTFQLQKAFLIALGNQTLMPFCFIASPANYVWIAAMIYY
ncbi:hypothetical protein L5515_006542 [Caenorhabditis briggsae]|uniref:Uncharacterized protein n=1 Tax=Caenorhabditis briggsae TaxID=6238 RepID=A0AAE9F4Q5_CAEBR|nr:hypothetical protein L5515_006542 [Caenorhabditis briggsae]